MKIEVNSIQLAYEKSGQGTPILLLHGNGGDHHIFDTLALKLQNEFTVYAVDSRNHGESSKTEEYGYETMAEDIAAMIESLQLKNIAVVGFSDGAILALLLAIKHPGLIHKMALLGVNLKPTDFIEEIYQELREMYEKSKEPLLKLMLEQPNIELEEVKNVDIPTLVVAGEHDVFKPVMFEKLAHALPNGELLIMKGHEHETYLEEKDILYPDLLAFLK
ncbi:alpha/beta fold hydrolase [Scatolibacter rhodanostii]|uniref:alpha/beta fold hydrolase n=1 Tax=Scatolibacter rhodanostii TaxID=2014781 RepID=UPI000C08A5E3|nr:alpha/beta hydrolase [Scatolibacter rhodanostii]